MAAEEQTPEQMFQNSKVLTVSETGLILDTVTSQQRARDPDYQPPAVLLKAMEYCQRFSTNKNRETLDRMRAMLAAHSLTEVELGQLANLSVETADEARKLVPSLSELNGGRQQPLSDEELDAMLREMATYREFE